MWKFLFSIQQEITMFPCCLLSKELISILQYMKVSNTVVQSQDNKDLLLICEEVPYTYKTNIGDDRISKHVKDCPLLDLQVKTRRRST